MKTFKFEPYRGMKPNNHETMDALLRMRFWQMMKYLRDYTKKAEVARFWGVMDGTVAAMYDLGSPMAYQYHKALRKIKAMYKI